MPRGLNNKEMDGSKSGPLGGTVKRKAWWLEKSSQGNVSQFRIARTKYLRQTTVRKKGLIRL